jgi:hypothetical protein
MISEYASTTFIDCSSLKRSCGIVLVYSSNYAKITSRTLDCAKL